jgi:hypothetical protein
MNVTQKSSKTNAMLNLAVGMTLTKAEMNSTGFEMIFEDTAQRVEIRFLPKMYPDGRVVIDAVNDLTIKLEVKRTQLSDPDSAVVEQIELPYSTWFGEDYM